MRFVIVTGMSGAGKRTVMKILEDAGFFCVDNLPVQLILKFYMLAANSMGDIDRVALGIDIRNGEALEGMDDILACLDSSDGNYEILYMDASDSTLIKRFKQERRSHPLIPHGRVEEGIDEERKRLSFLKKFIESPLLFFPLQRRFIRFFVKLKPPKQNARRFRINNYFTNRLIRGFFLANGLLVGLISAE